MSTDGAKAAGRKKKSSFLSAKRNIRVYVFICTLLLAVFTTTTLLVLKLLVLSSDWRAGDWRVSSAEIIIPQWAAALLRTGAHHKTKINIEMNE